MSEKKLNVPDYLNAPWLTKEYVQKHGWYPIVDEWLDTGHNNGFAETTFGYLPVKGRAEFKAGDIIIFNEFDEREIDGKIETDRFITVEQEEIDQYKDEKRDLLPSGIVVHPPKTEL